MIYVGIINFGDENHVKYDLVSLLNPYLEEYSTLVKKPFLTLCYGKLSNVQDMDDVWEDTSSITLGRVFDKLQQCSLSKEQFKELSYLDTKDKLEKIWGKYIYINRKNYFEFEIVIDSTGQLPFFYHVLSNGNILFSSEIDLIFKVIGQKHEYNWAYLCSYLIYGPSSATQTPFQNIYELPPGCHLILTKNEQETRPFWNPLSSYQCSDKTQGNAVEILQTTLKPWITPYKNIYVSLSGGVDSSALVYSLKDIIRENQKLCALNYFHSSIKSSNELTHARRVCKETGIHLIEVDISNTLPFDPSVKKNIFRPNKPFSGLVSEQLVDNVFQHLDVEESYTFLSGNGSDHIFMRPPSKKYLADYLLENGLKGSIAHLKTLSQFYRDPFLSILKENAISLVSYFFSKRYCKRDLKTMKKESPQWINLSAYQNASFDFIHPIYDCLPAKLLPGKYEQIDALYDALSSINVEMSPLTPTYYPFLYQGVVEFALAFHTYDLCCNGYDRYPLRKAISDHFKTDTVWRRDKSQIGGVLQLGIKKNIKYILDVCLEGHLIKQKFIDKEGLYKTIMQIANGNITGIRSFMNIVCIELFLRHWEEKSL